MNVAEYQSVSERPTLRACIIPPPPEDRRRLLFAVHIARKLGIHRTWLGRVLVRHVDEQFGFAMPKENR